MAERDAIVLDAGPGHLRLKPTGSTCRGCSSGCGGRCSLFASGEAIEFCLSTVDHAAAVGEQVIVQIDDTALRQAAWAGYGRCLLGLMLGAALGHVAGLAAGGVEDLLTLLGLGTGTFAAIVFSKRHVPAPRLLPGRANIQPTECIHT